MPMESSAASFRWLMWVGVVVVLAGVGIFLIQLLLRFWWLIVIAGMAIALVGLIGWLLARK